MTMRWVCALLVIGSLRLSAEPPAAVLELEREVQGMRPSRVLWREIAWKHCLLEGVAQARLENKPILLWVFIHDPVAERC